nr:MAG TPA: HNH endonuclease bacteriophage, HNH Endonuclease, DNA.52A [Caudoviricetes sp.]
MFDYYGKRWKKKREHILRLDGYKCQLAKMFGKTEEAAVVHHIYPAAEYPQWAWCDWNLISVSLASHNKIENRKTGELTKVGKMLQKRVRPCVDWRRKK